MRVTWDPLPSDVTHGVLTGYHLTYTLVSIGGKPVGSQTTFVKTTNSSKPETVLHDLSSYATYCVTVAGVTSKGIGPIRGQDCAGMCPMAAYTNAGSLALITHLITIIQQ